MQKPFNHKRTKIIALCVFAVLVLSGLSIGLSHRSTKPVKKSETSELSKSNARGTAGPFSIGDPAGRPVTLPNYLVAIQNRDYFCTGIFVYQLRDEG